MAAMLEPGSLQKDANIYVTISPMWCGSITLPERAFVSNAVDENSQTVPSISFLVTHPGPANIAVTDHQPTGKPFRLLFDLGLRHSVSDYPLTVQSHLEHRRPYDLSMGTASRLRQGGLDPDDIDVVILSHVHYDHHGDPSEFTTSKFVVGNGSLKLLQRGLDGMGSHQHFDPGLLPLDRTIELSPVGLSSEWRPHGPFENSLNVFGDGTVYILDLPGHLPGHIGLLCRLGPSKWICLCGDAFHDRRLLSGEQEFAYWENEDGSKMCIHSEPSAAQATLKKLRTLQNSGVEIVAAHDHNWLDCHRDETFPNILSQC